MNTSRTRLLSAFLWIGSVAAAYVIGGKVNESAQSERSRARDASSGPKTVASSELTEARPSSSTEAKADKASVKDIILQARAALGSGMMGLTNMRNMFRVLGPLAELSEAEVQEALAEVEQTVKDPQQKMMFYSILLGQWAETDGAAALAYAKEKVQGQGPMMAGVLMSVVRTWSQRDPEAAWRWYLDARERGERTPMGGAEGYLGGIFGGMASANVDTALGRLAGLAEHERQQAMQGIAMSGMDPRTRDALLSRAASMDTKTRGSIYEGIMGTWMMTDTDGAVKWMDSLPEEERKPLASTAGSRLMFMNPEKGAELQLQNASEKELPQTYSRVISQWAGRDPQGAGDWLNKQPQGPQLDDARRSFAVTIAQRDPAGAFDWAKTVQDESARMDAYQKVYRTLNQQNPASANAALNQAGLSPEVAAQVRQVVAESTKPTGK